MELMKGLLSEIMQTVNLRKNRFRVIQRSLANQCCVVERKRQPFRRIIYTSINRVNNCARILASIWSIPEEYTDYFMPRWSHFHNVQRQCSERYQKLGCKNYNSHGRNQ